jgi:hypothetical protein
VTVPKGVVLHIGNCDECQTPEEAFEALPEDGQTPATLHYHGGEYDRSWPYKRISSLTVIGHDEPVFTTGLAQKHGEYTVISGVHGTNTGIRGWRGNKLLYIRDSTLHGTNKGTVNTGEGHGALEVHDSTLAFGGRANVDHTVYAHSDIMVFDHVTAHTGIGSHTLKLMGDKILIRDSWLGNVPPEYARRVDVLSWPHLKWFRWASDEFGGGFHDTSTEEGMAAAIEWYEKNVDGHKPPHVEGGPTGAWAEKPDWTLADWRQRYEEWVTRSPFGTTVLDAMACSDSLVENTVIAFDRRQGAGENMVEFRRRRTEHGGCADPRWWEGTYSGPDTARNPDFYAEDTWTGLGPVDDPQNARLKRHVFRDVTFNKVGPRGTYNTMRNHGTSPTDADYRSGTRESFPVPNTWIERSQVFLDAPESEITGNFAEATYGDCLDRCETPEDKRTAGVHFGVDVDAVTAEQLLRSPQLAVFKGLCEPDLYGFCASETPFETP